MNDLKVLAQETLVISQSGKLPTEQGVVDFADVQRLAENQTRLFTPDVLQSLLDGYLQDLQETPQASPTKIEVWACSTQECAYKMSGQGKADTMLLNFASAKNIGGGFLGGAKAQEEDLCRASGLYLCQTKCQQYYQENKREKSAIYTDHMIYSPSVPFFRINNESLLGTYFTTSVITAPAPNLGAYLAQNPNGKDKVDTAFRHRTGLLLALCRHLGYKKLILGAWGCGVFRNDPVFVAQVFADWLSHACFANAFDKVVFAIYDKSKDKHTLNAFAERFGALS